MGGTKKRLSKVAGEYGILPSQIHFYIRKGLLSPAERTKGGFYLFTNKDITALQQILRLQQQGLSLSQIKEKLDNLSEKEVDSVV